MSALTQGRALNFLESEFRGAAYAALAAGRRLRLIATNGDQATAGTEIAVGGGYAAGGPAITFNAATAQTGTFSEQTGNAALSITNMPAVTVNGVEIHDGAAGAAAGTRAAWGALTTARTTAAGDTLSFPADAVLSRI